MHLNPFSKNKSLAILLVVVMVVAQWVGLKHRVVHGSGGSAPQSLTQSVSGFGVNWSDQVNHSCVAFEAATVSAALASPCFVVPIVPNTHVLALWIAFASWQAPHTSHFSSRAPPA